MDIPARLEDLFYLDYIPDDVSNNNWDQYYYKGKGVPRVTHIISDCISKDYLLNWASKLGHQRYIIEKNKAATIGSKTHSFVEYYLTTGMDMPVEYNVVPAYMNNVFTAYDNFKLWLDNLTNLGYRLNVLFIEKPLVCKYYGGTTDCIATINDVTYILDFKTSKKITYEYILQACAYMIIINAGYHPEIPHIDGIGIIRIDKERKNKYEDLFLNSFIPYQSTLLDSYCKGFMSLVNAYYNINYLQYKFSEYKKVYDFAKTIMETKEGV